MTIEIRPANGSAFAREIIGAQLWRDLDAAEFEAIQAAWADAGVLVFRRQALSEAELVAFSARFGKPEVIHRTDWLSAEHPEIAFLSNLRDNDGNTIGRTGTDDLEWHTDQSYVQNPATGAVLYGVEIPNDGGGSTWWANMRMAYAALPAAIKSAIEGRRAIFDYTRRLAGYDKGSQKVTEEMRRKTPPITHAIVNTHPVTGAKALYLDPETTVGIEGMPQDEATDLLETLRTLATRPEFVYKHKWHVGDAVMWDNGVMLHRRDRYASTQRRFHKRTTIFLPADRHIVPRGRPYAA
ncbi:MAG: TauD/TfdA family dioxygenase [Burkholderiales bacterium]|nr:TauD/TfdA family dioxygenase [Burkholderiales bacterium]